MDGDLKIALLKNLIIKTKIVIVFFFGVLIFQIIGMFVVYNHLIDVEVDMPLGLIILVPIFICIVILDEFLVLRFLKLALAGKKKFATYWSHVLCILEILYPTVILYFGGVMFSEYMPDVSAFEFFNSPPLLVYIVLIILSVFHFDFRLSALVGFVAASGYAIVSVVFITDSSELAVNLSKAPLILVCGIAAGFVGNRLLTSVRESLASKNILINELDSRVKERTAEVESQKEQLQDQKDALQEKNEEIIDSINYAKRIQEAYLPDPDVLRSLLPESFLFFRPKDVVSGDFYWFWTEDHQNPNSDVFVAAADCTGHGVPGAIMSVVCCNAINEVVVVQGERDTATILNKVRDEVIQILTTKAGNERKDGMDIAFIRLNRESGLLQYSGAHNPLWLIKNGSSEDSEVIEQKANKQPIGNFERMHPFDAHEVQLEKGDSVYLFSDGFADQFGGEKGKKFKSANFKRLLLSFQGKTMNEQHELSSKAFDDWKGDYEQLDDVCLIGIKF